MVGVTLTPRVLKMNSNTAPKNIQFFLDNSSVGCKIKAWQEANCD
jgi:hypothetical protein